MQASRIVDQLVALRKRYPEAPLVVFVPRTQIGRAIEVSLARRQNGWQGMRPLIPRHYAEDVARLDLFRSERREAPVAAKLFRAARIVQDRSEAESADEDGSDAAPSDALPGWHLLADTVAQALDTLREGDVSVQAVQERAKVPEASGTLGVIAACYEGYVQALSEKGLYDDATVYQWAAERVRTGEAPQVTETVYAVAGAVDLPERAFQFLRQLRRRGRAFVRLGGDSATPPPPETAAARFSDVATLEIPTGAEGDNEADLDDETSEENTASAGSSDASGRFVRAAGARAEVRAALRNLLEEEVAFEEATIAYTDSRPYATLLADEAERAGIPLTMGTGLPAGQTRTGRSLRDLYDWIREDYDPPILVRMLRSGLLRTDRWLRRREGGQAPQAEGEDTSYRETPTGKESEGKGHGAPSFRAYEAATLLAERSYEPGREGLLSGLEAAIGELETEDRALTSREETRLGRLQLLKKLF